MVVFSCERIYNSSFEHNVDVQKKLQLFEHLIQYNIDVDDLKILNNKFTRGCISKHFMNIDKIEQKINKCAFLGNVNCSSYKNRINIFS